MERATAHTQIHRRHTHTNTKNAEGHELDGERDTASKIRHGARGHTSPPLSVGVPTLGSVPSAQTKASGFPRIDLARPTSVRVSRPLLSALNFTTNFSKPANTLYAHRTDIELIHFARAPGFNSNAEHNASQCFFLAAKFSARAQRVQRKK